MESIWWIIRTIWNDQNKKFKKSSSILVFFYRLLGTGPAWMVSMLLAVNGFFHKLLHNGLDNIVPIKTVRIHCNDAPWITGELKSLTRLRQRAYEQNSNTLYKFYRNLVNKERKLCRSNYYQTKVKDLHGKDSKKWWKECRRICGIERPSVI